MAVKHNNFYLFLALACFVGIIAIFVCDGYIGVYDTLVMDNGRFQQTIEADQWAREEKYGGVYPGVSMEEGGQADFTYTIENHRFSAYNTDIKITLWQNKVNIADIGFIPDEPLIIPAFGKKEITWSISSNSILPPGYTAGQSYYVTVKIERGNIARDINLNVNTFVTPGGIKVIPAPVP